MEENPFAE